MPIRDVIEMTKSSTNTYVVRPLRKQESFNFNATKAQPVVQRSSFWPVVWDFTKGFFIGFFTFGLLGNLGNGGVVILPITINKRS